jgi:hypothetical protein
MMVGDDAAVAIEAKFTEPRYESVATWLGAAPSTNRVDVLDGWLGAIEAVVQASIPRGAVIDLPYQLIHRTASVCCVERPKRLVVYQVFGDSPADYYGKDLEWLATTIAATEQLEFVVLGCAYRPTDAFTQLVKRWDNGERTLGDAVRDGLLGGPLLDFHEPGTRRISAAC